MQILLVAIFPDINPIPGTTSVAHLQEDLGVMAVQLNVDAISRMEALINQRTVQGSRYNAHATSEVDTENFWRCGGVGPRLEWTVDYQSRYA